MSDRHFELPAYPNLEYYRKQAKHLQRTYAAGDAAAQARLAVLALRQIHDLIESRSRQA